MIDYIVAKAWEGCGVFVNKGCSYDDRSYTSRPRTL